MDGLECKELLFSTVKKANKSTRFDPEYYSKLALSTESFIISKPHYFLDTRNVVSGPFGSTLKSSSYLEKGDVPFVRIENIKGGFYISRSNLVYISSFDNNRIANSQLSEDDIVLSKVGNSIGFFARVDSILKECNISENNIGIKLEGFSTAQKHTILTYFNSIYGQILLLRRRSGNAQPKLNVDDMCFIPIPVFDDKFCSVISNKIINSEILWHQSQDIIENTSERLLSELNYSTKTISTETIVTRTLSESYSISCRLDAEYFQLKYDDYYNLLSNYKYGFTTVEKEFRQIRTKCNRDEEKYSYIEIGDIDVTNGISTPNEIITQDLPDNAKIMTQTGDILISTVRPNRGAVSILDKSNLLVSGAFTVLREKTDYKKEVLFLLFRTELYKDWLLKYNVGTSYPVIKDNDVLKMPIPCFPQELQLEICNNVQQSLDAYNKAKELLSTAIRVVEIAIENGEDAALKWLDTKVD